MVAPPTPVAGSYGLSMGCAGRCQQGGLAGLIGKAGDFALRDVQSLFKALEGLAALTVAKIAISTTVGAFLRAEEDFSQSRLCEVPPAMLALFVCHIGLRGLAGLNFALPLT